MDIQTPESMSHFSAVLVLLGVAGLTVPFLNKFKVSPVLGYLLCGILLGPHGLVLLSSGFQSLAVVNDETVKSFAELGIVFLMFMIGLKLSLNDLWNMRHHILGLGSAQIIVTALVVTLIARAFGNTMELSVLLGACFALSSTAVVLQLFEEQKRMHDPAAKLSFSILLMQDLAVVPILTLLTAVSVKEEGQSLFMLMSQAIVMAVIAIVAIYFLGKKILQPLLHHLKPEKNPEWLMSFALFVVIGTAMLTESIGLSAALGAFLAGILLAETEYKDDIERMIAPMKGLMLGIFFLTVGMMIDVRAALQNPFWILASIVGIGCLKAAILFILCLLFKIKKQVAAETAIMLGQGGEFVFVIVTMALAYQIIPVEDAQFFMLVAAVSLLMTPFIAAFAPKMSKRIAALFGD